MENEYTKRERLADVDEAIRVILKGGQSYKLGSRSVTRADLKQLRQMREDLAAQISNEEPSTLLPNTFVAVFEGR